nr:MAG TPA: Major capsid protein [Microviridae sp.]
MAGLFSYGDVKNKPRRSGFDLGNKNAFTAKVGELLPVYWKFCLPSDKFKISQEWFTRTQPVDTSAFTRIREYYEWFFVPLHLMYRNSNEAIMSMENQPNYAASGTQSITFNKNLPWVDLQSIHSALENVSASTYSTNMFGLDRRQSFHKICQYLGTGVLDPAKVKVNARISAFPFYAYQKIYMDYYRDSQWEVNKPWTYNCDFWNGGNSTPVVVSKDLFDTNPNDSVFELRYASWNKGLFTGALPNKQFGDTAYVAASVDASQLKSSIDGTAAVSGNMPVGFAGRDGMGLRSQARLYNPVGVNDAQQVTTVQEEVSNKENGYFFATGTDNFGRIFNAAKVDGSEFQVINNGILATRFDVLQLRAAECLQKWKEIAQANGQNYAAQVKAHFGVSPNPMTSHRCQRICGFDGSIDISAVENTNLSSDEAVIRGKGIGGYRVDNPETFTTNEHGILMCIYHATPLLDYIPTGPDLQFLTTVDGDSWPVPELDSIGLEALPQLPLINSTDVVSTKDSGYFGYVPRYISWKTSVDVVRGAFSTTLRSWTAPVDADYLHTYFQHSMTPGTSSVSYPWYKVNPSVLNTIFGVAVTGDWDTDQLLCNCQFNVKVARNLSYDGMPY